MPRSPTDGRMTSRKYTDKDNVERTAWNCVLSSMEMLDPASGSKPAPADPEGDLAPDDIPF